MESSTSSQFLVENEKPFHVLVFLWSNLRLLIYPLLLLPVYFWFKYSIHRSHASKYIAGIRPRFWNVLGDVSNIQSSKVATKMFPPNVHLLQLLSGYSALFREKEVFCLWITYVPLVFCIRSKAVEELISGTKMNEKGWPYRWLHPWMGTGLLTSHGTKWKSRRKLLTPSFHFDILKDFMPIFNEQAQILVQTLRKEVQNPWTDIRDPITLCTLDIICETTLGASVKAQENSESEYVKAVLRAAHVFMKRVFHPQMWLDFLFYLSKEGRQFKEDLRVMHTFTKKVIQDKKRLLLSGNVEVEPGRKKKALMDLLLDHQMRNHDITEEDIREEVDTFAFEGHDTTSMGISWALYLIGVHKEVQEKLHEEIDLIFGDDTTRPVDLDDIKELKYMDCVLKESQRLYPSVPMFLRNATEDVTICGNRIPKGTACGVLTYELHRDPQAFPNPEMFDPDRFLPENSNDRHPFAYIPFSAGPRNCIGQRFAIMEEKVVVAYIMRNFHLESLDSRDCIHPAPEMILRSNEPLKIKITPRYDKPVS